MKVQCAVCGSIVEQVSGVCPVCGAALPVLSPYGGGTEPEQPPYYTVPPAAGVPQTGFSPAGAAGQPKPKKKKVLSVLSVVFGAVALLISCCATIPVGLRSDYGEYRGQRDADAIK